MWGRCEHAVARAGGTGVGSWGVGVEQGATGDGDEENT